MIFIKRIKLDRIEYTEYGVEHWFRFYTRYRDRFFKTWQLVIADEELSSHQLAYELAKCTQEVKAHVKSVSKINKFSIFN